MLGTMAQWVRRALRGDAPSVIDELARRQALRSFAHPETPPWDADLSDDDVERLAAAGFRAVDVFEVTCTLRRMIVALTADTPATLPPTEELG